MSEKAHRESIGCFENQAVSELSEVTNPFRLMHLARLVVNEIHRLLDRSPPRLVNQDQLRECSSSITANIREAYGRPRDQIAIGSCVTPSLPPKKAMSDFAPTSRMGVCPPKRTGRCVIDLWSSHG